MCKLLSSELEAVKTLMHPWKNCCLGTANQPFKLVCKEMLTSSHTPEVLCPAPVLHFVFADFKPLLRVSSLHPHPVAEPGLHWVFSGHHHPVHHFHWLNCVWPQTGESAVQPASSPSCNFIFHRHKQLFRCSFWLFFLLLCVLLRYYRFIAVEEFKGSYLGVLNFPRRLKSGIWGL